MTETRQYPADEDTWDGRTERPPPNDAILLDDVRHMRKWITALREQVDQGLSAAEDATRPVQERVLSRHEARRRIEKATETIYHLLDAAERGLP